MPMPQAKKNASGLGRALMNRRAKEQRKEHEQQLHTTELPSGLSSVTQESSLDEFLNTAQLAGTEFAAERRNQITTIATDGTKNPFLLSAEEHAALKQEHDALKKFLRVPRRPHWTREMSKHELDRIERASFLEWRRGLAELQDGRSLLLTPFERNLEVWRQLWRTIERSQVLVQIVDARNPLAFRCDDLEEYVSAVPITLDNENGETQTKVQRTNLLLINKADLLTASQRSYWAQYFDSLGIKYAFFSAVESVALLQGEKTLEQEVDEEIIREEIEKQGSADATLPFLSGSREGPRVLSVEELESLFLECAPENEQLRSSGRLTVGLVGYPNVGKSSTINALVGSKKVSVSSTPGKTKHFQTILLSDEVELCDCPGLVFPQFSTTRADLVCNGVLPIDQLREFTAPVDLVVGRVGKEVLEATYGIQLDKYIEEDDGRLTAHGLLSAYAAARGYYTQGQGIPDASRASRYVLKDYVNAKILYCYAPPNVDEVAFNREAKRIAVKRAYARRKRSEQRELEARAASAKQQASSSKKPNKDFDADFFANQDNRNGVTIMSPNGNPPPLEATGKKHFKGNKRKQKQKK